MKYELDLSPTLINRTAIAHIGRDAVLALQSLAPSLAYFGERSVATPIGAEADRLTSILMNAIDRSARGLPPSPSRLQSGEQPDRRVFLDPLYVLFYELREEDVVMVLDLSVLTSPHWHNPAVGNLYDIAFSRIASIQPKLISISQNTAETFVANFGYPRRDIEVIHLYVPDSLAPGSDLQPDPAQPPYFLFVGSLEARKNVVGAIRSFALSGLFTAGFRFLIAGGRGHGYEAAEAEAAATPGVMLLGRVSDADLRRLYANATGFLYPSYLEGFGVPLLEALRYGVPAVASLTGACPEVGGDLISYCDPDDHEAIAGELVAISSMKPEDRERLRQEGRMRIDHSFSRRRFQERFLAAVVEP